MIVPHKERTFDKERENTTLEHIIQDFKNNITVSGSKLGGHYHIWVTETFMELIKYMINVLEMKWEIVEVQDVDDKACNGFTVVIRKLATHKPIRSIDIQKNSYPEAIASRNELDIIRAELKTIHNSHGWKLLKYYYKFRDKIFPVNTKRRAYAKSLWKITNKTVSMLSKTHRC